MCGIAGFIDNESRIDFPHISKIISNSFKHRGPDDNGERKIIISDSKSLSLIHRRLSIIDVSSNGHQPMKIQNDWIVFNGEIYNFKEVRDELISYGYTFIGHSDTEVLLCAYLKWGTSLLNKIEGMFAFAIWDSNKKELFLATDPLGIKPLYWNKNEKGFYFSSEIRAMLNTNLFEKKLNPKSVNSFLAYGAVQGPDTIIKNINLLSGGSLIKVDQNGEIIELKKYWQPNFQNKTQVKKTKIIDQLNDLMIKLTGEHLNSDVPTGLFLSGGIDSTALAYFSKQNKTEINSFSIDFNEQQWSEGELAKKTANIFNLKHTSTLIDTNYVKESLFEALSSLDQPSIDGVNIYIISKIIKECGIKVALSGLGSDELFGGYPSFTDVPKGIKIEKLISLAPNFIRGKLKKILLGTLEKNYNVPSKFSQLLGQKNSQLDFYLLLRQLYPKETRNDLFSAASEYSHPFSRKELDELENLTLNLDSTDAMTLLELKLYCGQTLLRDSDVMGMANSLEIRVPFLDKRLVELVSSIPASFKLEKNRVKPLLLDAARGNIRNEVWNRPKMGFVFPFQTWLKSDLKYLGDNCLLSGQSWEELGFNKNKVESLWNGFLESKKDVTYPRIWSLIVLHEWCSRNNVSL